MYYQKIIVSIIQLSIYFTTGRRSRVRFSIGSFEIFHYLNLSGRTMALSATQSLAETGTTGISWGVKAADA
jgi:hypothetical protein